MLKKSLLIFTLAAIGLVSTLASANGWRHDRDREIHHYGWVFDRWHHRVCYAYDRHGHVIYGAEDRFCLGHRIEAQNDSFDNKTVASSSFEGSYAPAPSAHGQTSAE